MHAKAASLFLTIAFGFVAFAQPQAEQNRTLYFSSIDTPQGMQEVANAIRAATDIAPSLDTSKKSVALRGPAGQVDMSEWLFRELDQPPAPVAVTREYPLPGTADVALRVVHLANTSPGQALWEMVNMVRTVADVQRLMPVAASLAIAMRAPAAQMALAEWVLKGVDAPAGAERPQLAVYRYQDPRAVREIDSPGAVRVFYLKHVETPQSVQEIVNLIRTISDIQRMYPYQPLKAIAMRATPNQAALAEWLIRELDQPALAAKPAASYQAEEDRPMAQGDVRVFRLAGLNTTDEFIAAVSRLRTETRIQRIFPNTAQKAIALLGSASQVTAAEQLIKQWE